MNTSMIIMSVLLAVCVVLLPFVINGIKQGNYYAPYIAALTMPILPWLIAYRLKGFRENRETISFIYYFVFEIIAVFAALALFI